MFQVSIRRLPLEIYDWWSIADLNAYVNYADAKIKRGNKKPSPTYTQDNIEALGGEGGAL